MPTASKPDAQLSEVRFHVRGAVVHARYDRRSLRLGQLVHVTFSDADVPSFSPAPCPSSIPHAVMWIAPSDWTVLLQAEFTPSEDYGELLKPTGLDQATIDRAISAAARQVRLEHMFKTRELERTALNVFSTVGQRLQLVEKLDSDDLGRALNNHQEPLVTYLMLTCFDRLGQPADWLDFGAWLKAGEKLSEREAVLQSAPAVDPWTFVERAHRTYSDLYGVSAAFFRFIREVLPPQARSEMLGCIHITRFKLPPTLSPLNVTDEDKEKWLLRLRNDYTHNGRFIRNIPIHARDNAPSARSVADGAGAAHRRRIVDRRHSQAMACDSCGSGEGGVRRVRIQSRR